MMVFKNLRILGEDYTFYNGDIAVKDGVFSDNSDSEAVDCKGLTMLPGLIDTHFHGADGCDNMDTTFESAEKISRYMAIHAGVTTYLPTLDTASREDLIAAAKNIADAKKHGVSGAKIGGIHMEGPYFSNKYKGAQNPDYIRNPDIEEFRAVCDASGGLVRRISIAPELSGADEFIKAVAPTCAVALGHTDTDYETACAAFANGATLLTHTFNAMRGIHHRSPNAICAALDCNAYCELICDGMHVHEAVIRMLFKAAGRDKIVMISDSLNATGLCDGEYIFSERTIYVKDGLARLADGTISGSTTPLIEQVRRVVGFGIPLEDAVMAASLNPARAAGLDAGVIKYGAAADFLLVDDALNLVGVYVNGCKISGN